MKARHGVTAFVSLSFVFSAITNPSYLNCYLGPIPVRLSRNQYASPLQRFFYGLDKPFPNVEKISAMLSRSCDPKLGCAEVSDKTIVDSN
jgi:hypothetical protein